VTDALTKDARALGRILDEFGITLVFDVGANTGQYGSKLRAVGYHGRIVSFEPLSAAHAALCRIAAADPAWTVAPPMALSDQAGQTDLHVSAESDMSSLLPMRPDMVSLLSSARTYTSETVQRARLDHVFDTYTQAHDRIFLKLDTQGHDLSVLEGATGVLDRISGVQTELAIETVYVGEPDWLTAIKYIQTRGFRPVYFIPGYFNKRTARLFSMDGVFVRMPDASRGRTTS